MPILLLALAFAGPLLATPAHAQGRRGAREAQQESAPATGWHAWPLPGYARPSLPERRIPALLDGEHLRPAWSDEASRVEQTEALIPGQLLESVLQRALEAQGLRAMVQVDAEAVLLRGGEEARQRVEAELAALESQVARLRTKLRVRLTFNEAVLWDQQAEVQSGVESTWGQREQELYVADYGAEVSTDSAVADPEMGVQVSGTTLHLRALKTWNSDIWRLDGFLDRAVPLPLDVFDAGMPDFEHLELPSLNVLQLAFGGSVRSGEPWILELAGEEWGSLRLEIEIGPAEDAVITGHWEIWDFSDLADTGRGLPLIDPGLGWSSKEGGALAPRAALSPANLVARLGREFREVQPLWTDRLMLIPAGERAFSAALKEFVQSLTAAREGQSTLELTGSRAQGRLPLNKGLPVRLCVGRERVLVVDYNMEIAPESWAAEPVVERVFDGWCADWLWSSSALQSSAWISRSVTERNIAPDKVALGRLTLPQRRFQAAARSLRGGETVELLPDLTVTLPAANSR